MQWSPASRTSPHASPYTPQPCPLGQHPSPTDPSSSSADGTDDPTPQPCSRFLRSWPPLAPNLELHPGPSCPSGPPTRLPSAASVAARTTPSALARAHEGPRSHGAQMRRDRLLSPCVSPSPQHLGTCLAWALRPRASGERTARDCGKVSRAATPQCPVLTTATSTALAPEDGRSQSSTSRRSRATALVAGRARIPEQMAPTVVPWAETSGTRVGSEGLGPRLPHSHMAGHSSQPHKEEGGDVGVPEGLASQSPPAPPTSSRRGGGARRRQPPAPSPHLPPEAAPRAGPWPGGASPCPGSAFPVSELTHTGLYPPCPAAPWPGSLSKRALCVATLRSNGAWGCTDVRDARLPGPLTWGTWSRLKCKVRRAQLLSRWLERGKHRVPGSTGSSVPHSPQAAQGGCRHWPGAFSWHRCPGGHWALRASGRPVSRQGFRPHHTWVRQAHRTDTQMRTHRQTHTGTVKERKTRWDQQGPGPHPDPPQPPRMNSEPERPPTRMGRARRRTRPGKAHAGGFWSLSRVSVSPGAQRKEGPSSGSPQPQHWRPGSHRSNISVTDRRQGPRARGQEALGAPPYLAAVPAAIHTAAAVTVLHPGAPVREGHALCPAGPPEDNHWGETNRSHQQAGPGRPGPIHAPTWHGPTGRGAPHLPSWHRRPARPGGQLHR